VKTVRIQLTHARALSSIAIAPGFTEFQLVSVSGCVVDGETVNPALTACSVEVTFSPKYPGLRTAPLVLTDNAGIKSSVGLTGIGLAPQAALTPGIITTIAGNGQQGFGGDGGPATAASFYDPQDAQLDSAGNLYIADTVNNSVRKVDPTGIITTVVPADGSRNTINGLALDAAGNLYYSGGPLGTYIFKMDLNGVITRFAGGGSGGDGGPASEAGLSQSGKLVVDTAGNLYIAEFGGGHVRKVDTQGIISTVATGVNPVYGLAVDTAGNLYIPDYNSHIVQKVDTNGVISTIAGNGTSGFSGDGGPATQAELSNPTGVAVDAAGNLYVADLFNYRVRRIDTNGTIRTVAGNGNGNYSGDGGPATAATVQWMFGMATDPAGGFYVIDSYNNRIRKVDVSESAVNFTTPQNINTTSPSQEVLVTDTGNQHLQLTDLSLTGEFGQLTGTSRDCTNTTVLGTGFSCALRITLTPTTTGTLTGSATVTDNSLNVPGTTQAISLSGTGVNPATAILSTSALTFGNQPTNTTSPSQPVVITNTGGASLVISSIALTGANPASFVISNTCGGVVAGGGSCEIDVRFDPQTATQITASITITDNASNSPQTVTLSGTGVPGTGGPIATFSTTALDFTNNTVQSAFLTNTGGSPLVITSFTVTGPNAGSFLYGGGTGLTCKGPLARGASCEFSLSFSPQTTGAYSASLVVVDNASDSPQTIALTGNGPFATVSPTALDFGSQTVGTTSAPQTVTVTNTGGGHLFIQTITQTGANPTSFIHSSNCGGGGDETHGVSCQIMLSFKPTTTGPLSATITLTSNANSPINITVTGTGTAP
jgi:sugar lactone lactonase YvrE